MAAYVIGCGSGYWVLDKPCVRDPNEATRIKYLQEAKRYADLLNQAGYCGGGCSVSVMEAEVVTMTDKMTGRKVDVLNHKPKKYKA